MTGVKLKCGPYIVIDINNLAYNMHVLTFIKFSIIMNTHLYYLLRALEIKYREKKTVIEPQVGIFILN